MGNPDNRDVALIASAPWRADGRLNCHHIAERLARSGRRVLYVESTGLRTPNLRHTHDLARIIRRAKSLIAGLFRRKLTQVRENLFVLSPAALPMQGKPFVAKINGNWLRKTCRKAASSLGFNRPILWIFLPTGISLVGYMDESAVIYHCVDYYARNPGVNSELIESLERQIAGAADICFATSRPLADRLAQMGAKVEYLPNVAETERFMDAPEKIPDDIADLPRPVIGYVGNAAAYKIDIELLCEIADKKPDWSIAIVGPRGAGDPSTKLDVLERRKNVHLLGAKSYDEVPAYVHSFDVCLIPFRRSEVTDSSFPLKTFEYLAAGKPVVSVALPSLVAEDLHNVVKYASNPAEFIERIEESLLETDTTDIASVRRKKAAEYSWERRFKTIEELLNRISVKGDN